MPFSGFRVKNIEYVIRFSSTQRSFESKNKQHHIIGLKCSGNATHTLADRKMSLNEGDIYFLNMDEDYLVEQQKFGMSFSVHFTTYEPIELKGFAIPAGDTVGVLNLLEKIERSFLKNGTNAETLYLFYKLFTLFEDIYNRKYHPIDQRLISARDYMNLHYKEKNCLDLAVELYGVSRRRFCDVFKDCFNVTPNRFLVLKKIEFAKNLLAGQELSIEEVGELCGFSDVYYFSKTFKKETGLTPAVYKKQFAQKNPM